MPSTFNYKVITFRSASITYSDSLYCNHNLYIINIFKDFLKIYNEFIQVKVTLLLHLTIKFKFEAVMPEINSKLNETYISNK